MTSQQSEEFKSNLTSALLVLKVKWMQQVTPDNGFLRLPSESYLDRCSASWRQSHTALWDKLCSGELRFGFEWSGYRRKTLTMWKLIRWWAQMWRIRNWTWYHSWLVLHQHGFVPALSAPARTQSTRSGSDSSGCFIQAHCKWCNAAFTLF